MAPRDSSLGAFFYIALTWRRSRIWNHKDGGHLRNAGYIIDRWRRDEIVPFFRRMYYSHIFDGCWPLLVIKDVVCVDSNYD